VRRPPEAFRSAWLCELEPEPWARALVRHLLYDLAEERRWHQFARSTLPGLSDVAAKALVEEHYHRRHAVDLVVRLGQGTADARARLQAGLDELWPLAMALFEPTGGEADAVAAGVLAAPVADLRPDFAAALAEVAAAAGLTVPDAIAPVATGARTGTRHAAFASAHEQMLAVFAYDPSGRW
jgi:ring-1,2-phenylacetyl-CoA epoxidase subunit PaaC